MRQGVPERFKKQVMHCHRDIIALYRLEELDKQKRTILQKLATSFERGPRRAPSSNRGNYFGSGEVTGGVGVLRVMTYMWSLSATYSSPEVASQVPV